GSMRQSSKDGSGIATRRRCCTATSKRSRYGQVGPHDISKGVGLQEAELVALGIAQYLPAAPSVDIVGPGGAERQGLLRRGGEVATTQVEMQAVLARFRLGHWEEVERQAFRGVQRGIALGMDRDRAAEHATPPARQPYRVAAVDSERGDAQDRRGLLTHAMLLFLIERSPVLDKSRLSQGHHRV